MSDENKNNGFKKLSPEARVYFASFFKGDICPLEVTYREENLLQLANKLKWQGNGSEQYPFLITTSEGLAKEFRILHSSLFIQFENCNFDIIWLGECQNVSFEKNSFKKLFLWKSSDLKFKECQIPYFSMTDSKDNYFEHCSINSAYNVRSNSNVFKNCQFPEDVTKTIKKGTYSSVLRYFALFTIVLGIGFFYFLISSGFTLNSENLVYLISFGGGFLLCVLLWILHLFGRVPSSNLIIVDDNFKK